MSSASPGSRLPTGITRVPVFTEPSVDGLRTMFIRVYGQEEGLDHWDNTLRQCGFAEEAMPVLGLADLKQLVQYLCRQNGLAQVIGQSARLRIVCYEEVERQRTHKPYGR